MLFSFPLRNRQQRSWNSRRYNSLNVSGYTNNSCILKTALISTAYLATGLKMLHFFLVQGKNLLCGKTALQNFDSGLQIEQTRQLGLTN